MRQDGLGVPGNDAVPQATADIGNGSQPDLQKYKWALDQHAIVSVADVAGCIVEVNSLFCELSGYRREELLGQDHRLLNSGLHPPKFFEQLWCTIKSGQVWHGNVRNRRKDGSHYWLASTIVPLLTDSGKPYQYVSIHTDITPQVVAQEEQHRSAELFRLLFDTVTAGVLLHAGGKLIHANSAAERITGYTREELLHMDFWELAHSDSRLMLQERGAARLRGEEVQNNYELQIHTKSGIEIWVEAKAVVTEYRGEQVVLATFVDVTERKCAELVQRQAQQTLNQIIRGTPVPTLVINADHVVTHWNQACEAVTGIAASAVIGTRNQWQAFYPKQRPLLADLLVSGASEDEAATYYLNKLQRSPLNEDAYEAEAYFPGLGGPQGRWLYFNAAPLKNDQDQVVGAIETLQDFTARKLAETALQNSQAELERLVEQRTKQLAQANLRLEEDVRQRDFAEVELLRRNAELTSLNSRLSDAQAQLLQSEKLASIGQLAAGVAHEINNPIGYVHSNIGALDTYLGDLFRVLDAYASADQMRVTDTPERSELLRLISELDLGFLREDIPKLMAESKEGIVRVRKIVQDLKDFSHVDRSQEWKWADLHKGLDSTLNVVSNEIKYKADVVKNYGALPEIECLPSELNQVFLNLLVNAAHAIAEGQRGVITLHSGLDGEWVWVEVADSGSGIAPENMKRIFDPFFTTKPVGKGTGLGLSLAYGIVQKHGGRIDVESQLGQGSIFRVVLPVRQNREPELV